jgi:hypothetical protein
MNLPQVEFTSPAEWNPDLHDDNRTQDEMIRQFPAVPHDATSEFYDLTGSDDENIDPGIPDLQPCQHKDTSSDDDSGDDKKSIKTSTTMLKWKFPIDDSNGEKFTCHRVREQRAKCNAKRVNNRRKKAALKKELIKNTPFAEDADEPFIPFIDPIFNKQELSMIVNNEVEFFPTDPHPFRTGTIIEENGFLFKEREMDGLIFYDSLQVLDDPNKTLDIISDSNQHWTTCSEAPPIISTITHLLDSGCSPGTIGFVDTFSDMDYLNDLSLFRPTENEYWNDWLLDEPTRRLMTQSTIDKCNQYNINANDLSSVMNPLKPRMTKPTDIDYESKRKYFAHLPASVVKATFNSFQAIVPYMGQKKGVLFYGGVSPSKIGLRAPY